VNCFKYCRSWWTMSGTL